MAANTQFDPADVPAGGSTLENPSGVRGRWLRVEGLRTRVLESGPRRGGRAVVFVHGNPGSSQDWLDLLPRAGDLGERALAFDLPGFGHADKPFGGPYTLDRAARWFGHALRALGVRRVDLVVHDLGGPLAMRWAAHHPNRLRSAVIIDSGLLLGYRYHYLARIWRTPAVGELFMQSTTRETFTAGIQNGQQRPLPVAFVNRMYDDYDRATRCAILAAYRSADQARLQQYAAAEARAFARRPHRPALVLWGAHDPYLPVAMAERQREGFPAAEVHICADCAHWPFVDRPLRTRRLVIPFLRRAIARR